MQKKTYTAQEAKDHWHKMIDSQAEILRANLRSKKSIKKTEYV